MLRFLPNTEKPAPPYTDPDGNCIAEKDHLRDFGVELLSDLTFSMHIENIVSFTFRVSGVEGLDYLERLAKLRMYSQERCRERYQIIFVWKLS